MTSTVRQWLAERITGIDSVQKCVLGTDPDITVHSWRGVIIHVHLLDQPAKTRALKKSIQEATRVGVGTLFVVDERLLPADGARLIPDDWLLTVHLLSDDKIYAYRDEADGPHLRQVHFKPVVKGEEREVWYGPDIRIDQLPFYRIWVRTPSLKGDFLIANFAADAFWHNRDFRAQRAAAEEQRRAERRAQYTRYDFGYGGAAGPEVVTRQKTRLEMSYAELGLARGVPCDDVKAAFRKLAREMHPDVSPLPKGEAENRFRKLTDAYNFIRANDDCG